jgi:hypothetical protein
MMRGEREGFTGSCVAEKILVAISTDNKLTKKRTRILSNLLVLAIKIILIKKRRLRTDVCIRSCPRNSVHGRRKKAWNIAVAAVFHWRQSWLSRFLERVEIAMFR